MRETTVLCEVVCGAEPAEAPQMGLISRYGAMASSARMMESLG